MKHIHSTILLVAVFLGSIFTIEAQKTLSPVTRKFTKEELASKIKSFPYDTVANDPLKARIYKLDNGLTVYMSVYKDAPRIQTYIAVKAGSKNDPSDATGLAHYLEHMVFKGTDKFGTKDYEKEKPYLDKIENLYETYRKTNDEKQRKKIYREIDSLSGIAATHAIANEYDKMISAIGAKGSNAYTSFEQTVYTCDIPSNQLEKWVTIEAERFRAPVMRIFHTELEAVYEEKNRTLDDDNDKTWEALFAALFPTHTYGTQTTIGTIEHLKNPSIKKIREYYDTYYVPNNMAICLSGDFNPELTIRLIDMKFGALKARSVPAFNSPVEEQIKSPISKTVVGPDAESVFIGYRFNGVNSPEADMITIIDKLLYNGTAGLFDLNLNQQQKALNSASLLVPNKDYMVHVLIGNPKEGQSLEDLKKLLLSQIDAIKKGEFNEWLLPAIINDLKLQKTKNFENNDNRADAFVQAFTTDMPWNKYVDQINRLSQITKKDIVEFANKFYSDNYAVVYKKTGEDKNVVKVIKPEITPVEVNRNDKSNFLKQLTERKTSEIQPVFVDYNKDIQQLSLKNKLPVLYTPNTENTRFDLYYILDMGTNHDKKLSAAVEYLRFLGTSKLSPAQVQEEFYKLGCSYEVFSSEDQVYVTLTGLSENFKPALKLFEELLSDCQPNEEALANLVEDILKIREDNKLNKNTILWAALYNYGMYGTKSPFTNVLSEKELRELKPADLINTLKSLIGYQHRVLYYGPMKSNDLLSELNAKHAVNREIKSIPQPVEFIEANNEINQVFVVDYDMKQAEIVMLSKSEKLNKANFPKISLFSEYFGGGMASIVFQTLRESKALAYGVSASYQKPKKADKSHFVMAYIGTQSDKLPEAMAGMFELLNDMPESELSFNAAKESVEQKIRTERITKSNILLSYERNRKLGIDYDYRKDIFEQAPQLTLPDIKAFHNKYMKDKKYNIMVLGDKESLDLKTLEKYGKVTFLSLNDVFGY